MTTNNSPAFPIHTATKDFLCNAASNILSNSTLHHFFIHQSSRCLQAFENHQACIKNLTQKRWLLLRTLLLTRDSGGSALFLTTRHCLVTITSQLIWRLNYMFFWIHREVKLNPILHQITDVLVVLDMSYSSVISANKYFKLMLKNIS